MKISARNNLKGKIIRLTEGSVNTEVIIKLSGGDEICSIITNESAKSLGLSEGKEAYAIIKASNVIIGADE